MSDPIGTLRVCLRVVSDWRVIVTAVCFVVAWLVVRAISDPYRRASAARRFRLRLAAKAEPPAPEPAAPAEQPAEAGESD